MGVPVTVILDRKGADVATIGPDASVNDAATSLTDQGIGALVVSADGRGVDGVISERDIVREVSRTGAAALEAPVTDVMTLDVVTCEPTTSTDDLIATMTERRVRHVPVVTEGRLVGIVSIGDIVKWRMDELAEEAQQLEAYVTGGY